MKEITDEEIIEINDFNLKYESAKYKLSIALYRLFAPLLNAVVDGYIAMAEAIDNAIDSGNEIDARKIILGGTP